MLSAICFNLEQSNILLSGNGFNPGNNHESYVICFLKACKDGKCETIKPLA